MFKNEHAQKKRATESRRERNKREKLERIEQVARRQFKERGYGQTTTRDIADAAEIGTGTLFVYFPEKLDLLLHIVQQDLVSITTRELDALPGDLPLVEACMRVFAPVLDYWEEDLERARHFARGLLFTTPERRMIMSAVTVGFMQRLGQVAAAGIERGEIRADAPIPLVGHQLFGVYFFGFMNWLSGFYDRPGLEVHLRMGFELLVRGLQGETNDR
jgi:AcrR family transcriptional regulator